MKKELVVVNEELKPCVSVITPCYNGEKKLED